jgi:hypothetical protein
MNIVEENNVLNNGDWKKSAFIDHPLMCTRCHRPPRGLVTEFEEGAPLRVRNVVAEERGGKNWPNCEE